jgi:NADPH-dependent 2,4-dienoyl-CoA reductase/sulfur reductase-like enzyme/nitrite reductase/ring-hydroxylating ferredoxin subunit
MGGSDTQLTAPDLERDGVALQALSAGDKLLGHAFGDPVLLARVGDEYVAIGASCTHYGGPLAEGVVVGDVVRCPWHHACFSLRTGEALKAPALNPVACYSVEQRNDRVFVTAKSERGALEPLAKVASQASPPARVVIVGAGAAGTAAAEMLRREGFAGDVTMIDGEKDSPYDRPNLSKDYLAGNAPEEWIPIRPRGFHEQHRIMIVRANATRIDLAAKRVEVEGQDAVSYDALLLATGAEPIRLPLPGADLPFVRYLRSLADSRSIISAAASAQRAVVIGGSFIGLEVAASLRARNLEVHVVAPETLPLERVLGAELGTFIKALHEERGVQFHLGRKPERIEADAVVLDDGTRLPADLVVIGVGVRPRVSLAEAAGLTMEKGIAVNEFLETSAEGVYAAGDIARWPDPHSGERIRVEHWVVAERMGQTAARNILGARERFEDVPFFWSAHYDVSVNYVGHAESWDNVRVEGHAAQRDVAVHFEKNGRRLALATIFRDEESLRAEVEMEQSPGQGANARNSV